MKKLVFFFLMFSFGKCFAQTENRSNNKISAYLGIDNSFSAFLWMNQLNGHIGIHLNERLFLQTGFGRISSIGSNKRPNNFHFYDNDYSLKFRLLRNKRKWSPTLQMNIGFGFKYNQTNDTAFVTNGDYIQNIRDSYTYGYFYRIKPYYSFQLGIEYHWSHFRVNFSTGPQKSTIIYQSIENTEITEHNSVLNWVFSASMAYQLRFRKE